MEETKEFKDIDRHLADEESGVPPEETDQSGQDEFSTGPAFLPEHTFGTFVLSLATSALVQLGELPDPISNQKDMNLPVARQTIGLIEMLEQKTRGNLTADEGRLMESLLYDLRMKYICAAKLPGCDR
jgi:hypothetical protein